ncbi:hypothetical protein WR25_21245 isoform C [Diploscapter pachys]|uniref:G-protein coupled receptors family 1 profile domain-containing protein n=1 Tax=Diploscapter pachys TaxID=2018661 RepID=A0A2A2JDQ7_9BILA|nr:hypothetical protein WR25_21245 isoform C [Diploscapter pachys]
MSAQVCAETNNTEQAEHIRDIVDAISPFMRAFNTFHDNTYHLLCIFGVLANILIIVVLLRPSMRKSPFNLFLIIIAVCDASLLATYWIYKLLENECNPRFFNLSTVYYTLFYANTSMILHSVSLWLTVNMAILRYLVIYRGSRSTSRLPQVNGYPAAIIGIILAVVITLIGSFPLILYYTIQKPKTAELPPEFCYNTPYEDHWRKNKFVTFWPIGPPTYWNCAWEKLKFWMAAVILKIIPCVLLTIFMALLVWMLMEARERRARICGGATAGNSQAERTTAMLTCIVAVFLITELPQGIITSIMGINTQYGVFAKELKSLFDFLSLLNSAINFILCALMSHVFRR